MRLERFFFRLILTLATLVWVGFGAVLLIAAYGAWSYGDWMIAGILVVGGLGITALALDAYFYNRDRWPHNGGRRG